MQTGFGVSRRFPKKMGLFRRKVRRHFIRIHPDNIASKDWIILLEAGTIVGPSADKLRVAAALQERKIVKKHNVFLRKQYFLVLESFDPRIHSLYFCPQLYQLDSDNKLVALEGEEIGKLLAQRWGHRQTAMVRALRSISSGQAHQCQQCKGSFRILDRACARR